MTKDNATWTQGKLLQEVYRLKGIQTELVEALKTLVYNCECIIETEGLQVLGLEIAKQAISRAESEPIK